MNSHHGGVLHSLHYARLGHLSTLPALNSLVATSVAFVRLIAIMVLLSHIIGEVRLGRSFTLAALVT